MEKIDYMDYRKIQILMDTSGVLNPTQKKIVYELCQQEIDKIRADDKSSRD